MTSQTQKKRRTATEEEIEWGPVEIRIEEIKLDIKQAVRELTIQKLDKYAKERISQSKKLIKCYELRLAMLHHLEGEFDTMIPQNCEFENTIPCEIDDETLCFFETQKNALSEDYVKWHNKQVHHYAIGIGKEMASVKLWQKILKT